MEEVVRKRCLEEVDELLSGEALLRVEVTEAVQS